MTRNRCNAFDWMRLALVAATFAADHEDRDPKNWGRVYSENRAAALYGRYAVEGCPW